VPPPPHYADPNKDWVCAQRILHLLHGFHQLGAKLIRGPLVRMVFGRGESDDAVVSQGGRLEVRECAVTAGGTGVYVQGGCQTQVERGAHHRGVEEHTPLQPPPAL
jgi:hypothetical protein